jgi:GH24 family phage-related lysozyme (muramidase)/peptidoglycan hydrolase-like protein with peptidoglycan-binding domain
MTYQLQWMPEVLLDVGLRVAECEGWRERGRADMGKLHGVMVHHTGTAKPGNMPTLNVLIDGRSDLRGPLANLGLGRDGTFYVIAAGRANHAGRGEFRQVKAGNSCFIGIEAEHCGDDQVPWPKEQIEAYQRGVAALLARLGMPLDLCIGHKEWALPKGRKSDPCFDMVSFRNGVSDYLQGRAPPAPIPIADPAGRPTLRRGSAGDAAEELQEIIGVRADGLFGRQTEAALRRWQSRNGLQPDGICGPLTWAKLIAAREQARSVADTPPAHQGSHELSERGIELIHSFESCAEQLPDGRFAAYPDPGSSTGRPWTIGWGSTGPEITKGTIWTREECDRQFADRIRRYVQEVNEALSDAPTTQNQFDALVSFHYNTGAIESATLTKYHRAERYADAQREFGRWIYNDRKPMTGLVRRRKAEAALYAEQY